MFLSLWRAKEKPEDLDDLFRAFNQLISFFSATSSDARFSNSHQYLKEDLIKLKNNIDHLSSYFFLGFTFDFSWGHLMLKCIY